MLFRPVSGYLTRELELQLFTVISRRYSAIVYLLPTKLKLKHHCSSPACIIPDPDFIYNYQEPANPPPSKFDRESPVEIFPHVDLSVTVNNPGIKTPISITGRVDLVGFLGVFRKFPCPVLHRPIRRNNICNISAIFLLLNRHIESQLNRVISDERF